ncbi:MAG: hypothetical protein DA330_06565 [Nitrososphaera sp.]|nr:hypothetical protein [Nitrososphaera sp.]
MSRPISWIKDFIGVGYRYSDVFMNIFPIFEDNLREANKRWKNTVDSWPDDEIRLRFIEDGDDYWFILYTDSARAKNNSGFVKKMPVSENYKRFKNGYEKKAMLRFGTYKENTNPKKKDKDGNVMKYDLDLLKKAKSIYDISFKQISELSTDSVELQCIQQNRP